LIPTKVDSISITTKREKSLESIVDWFDQHKQSFYSLGWSYLKNQQQMEELFYLAIKKVHKELSRLKRETSIETWVTSIFIHTCRELSNNKSLQVSEESEPQQDLFKALDQLKESEKEAILLTYVKGISKEEAAHFLQVSVEKLKELLFSGIQSLRNEMGYGTTFNGCQEYHKNYLDYLERTLDRSKKIDLEVHVYHCQSCQEDLATFQDVMLTMVNLTEMIQDLHVPPGFMENVKDRLAKEEKTSQQKNKKRKRKGLVIASLFALVMGIGYFSGLFTNLYYSTTEEDQQLRTFLQHGLGERLNLEAESDGVKIKINGAIADDVQTILFYEIEDTKEDSQYVMHYQDGVYVVNEHKIMSSEAYIRYNRPNLESVVNKKVKNVYRGKISLPPLSKDDGTIKLWITKIQKLDRHSTDPNGYWVDEQMEYQTGKWNFEIPVTKQPSIEFALDKKQELEGIQVRFDKLTIAPTTTILQYSIKNGQSKKRIEVLNIGSLEVNDKKMKPDLNGGSLPDFPQDMNWTTFQTNFNPLYGEKPKEISVKLGSIYLSFEDKKIIELDTSNTYPHTFEYAGSTISIDKVEVGQPTIVVLSNHEIKNRAYESLQFRIVDESGNEASSMEMSTDGVIVDKNGVEYENDTTAPYDEIEQPRYFFTVQTMKLDNENTREKVNPKRLEILGYNTTKYLEDNVKVSLE
jgi:RNA polymerase sigma factor (sigma-70 family)